MMSLKARCLMASNLLYTLHFDPAQDRASIWREHLQWHEKFIRPHIKPFTGYPNDPSADRHLRVGYVSPDFSQNPVGRFMLPLLANHDHKEFEIFCYSDIRRPDAMTERLRACADVWRPSAGVSDERLIETIRADQIDILVDLSLHTRDNRLLVFAHKPAPVQVTYLAYCSTTGLEAMDYRLTDPYMDPPGRDDDCYSETSVRLPHCFWCYQPIVEQLEVSELPGLRNGCITFGCFNNYSKVSPLSFSNWCRLLKQIPGSRLVLFADPGEHRQRAWEQFEKEGLDPTRLWFSPFLPAEQYLRQYQQIDIALDPFPYGGGTTTFDALWMGVPVVSLAGDTAVSRAGFSILSNLGLPQLVTTNWDDYITIATQLAKDLPRLGELRSTMRQRMQDSPLMDAPRFARNVEAAFRQMWQDRRA
jgi:predicted O-linked N-acetylglucosamine transferase (SPINDLY family)